MNVLIVGSGKGSFTMRGQQLGAAIGARVTSTPTASDWTWAELVIAIKRWGPWLMHYAPRLAVPVVWDALDFWPQPGENAAEETRARQLLANQIAAIRPALVIGATHAMADAARDLTLRHGGTGAIGMPHHSWHGLEPLRPHREVTRVVYQGNPLYLGRWAAVLERLCADRGWWFTVDPPADLLGTGDLIVALRDGPWDGYMPREWKSGVKLVNAVACGRPVITQPSAAWREIAPPGSAIETTEELAQAFDAWTPYAAREAAFEQCRVLAPQFRLPAIAEWYRDCLQTVRTTCCA